MDKIRERLWEKAGKMKIPLTGAFELLPVCNLSCKMCYVRKDMKEVREKGGLINGKQWLEFAADAKKEGLLFPLLTGGEPFLHPDFQEILFGMQEMGMQVSINSNGTMIDEAMAEWLGKHCPVRINITLYGANEKTYENLCGNGDAFVRVHHAVELLKKNGVPIKFNTSITPENVEDLDDIIAYAKKVESPIQIATYMFPPIRRDSTMVGKNSRLAPEAAGYARVKADFLQNEPDWFRVQAKRFSQFVPIEKNPFTMNQNEQKMKMICRAGLCSFWIDWQGNLINCGMYASAKTSLKEKTFHSAWKELVEKTAEVRYAPACGTCLNQKLCHPCIAMVSNECGDINGRPEYLCQMNQAAARYYREFAEKYYPEEMKKIYRDKASEPASQSELNGCGLDEF